MGEILKDFALKFNGSLRLEAREERLTAEAGALLLREMDERLGLSRWLAERLEDPRAPERITHPLVELVRTHLVLLGQGWRDQDDADELRQDAALKLAVSERKSTGPVQQQQGAPQGLASQPTLSRTVGILSSEHNQGVLREGLVWGAGRRLRAKQPGGQKLKQVTMDVDSLVRRGPRHIAARRLAPSRVAVPAVPLLAVRARDPGQLEVCPPQELLHRSHVDQRQCKSPATLRE